MTKEKRDWPKILADLRASGYLTYKIAVHVGTKWDRVKNWENGIVEPWHSEGEMLLRLYQEVFGRTADAELEGEFYPKKELMS